MGSEFEEFLSGVSDAIWAPMAYVVLGLGVLYSVATKGCSSGGFRTCSAS